MGESGGMNKEQLKNRYYSLVVAQVQKGASPESIIPRLVRAGFSDDEAREMVNMALGAAGASAAPAAGSVINQAPVTPAAASEPARYEPITRDVTNEYTSYAGFWIRFLAVFIDNVIISFIMLPFNMVIQFSAMSSTMKGQQPTMPSLSVILLYAVIAILAPWLYFSLQESSAKMSTVGKRVCGLTVTDLEGQQISFAKATGRFIVSNISLLIMGIGYIMAAFTQKKQTLHDMAVGTVVIKVR